MTKGQKVALGWLILILVAAIAGELAPSEWGLHQNIDRILESPGRDYWFGTDSLGRDIFARLVTGTKVSLAVGLFGSLLSVSLGVLMGSLAGWFGGWADRALMRGTDVLLAVPSFALVAVLTLSFQSFLPGGVTGAVLGLILGIGFTHWMNVARVTRALVQQTKVSPFIEAARALGAKDLHIVVRHVFPNISSHLFVLFGLQLPANLLYESFMSFIGIGVQSPQTSWGLLVQEGWKSLSTFPHLILFPALVLFLTVWSLHKVGDRRR